jgi:hypothetical protein
MTLGWKPKIQSIAVDVIVTVDLERELPGTDELADSIATEGLRHPLVLDEDLHLMIGLRRLAAVRQLGWAQVGVTTVDHESFLLPLADQHAGWDHDRQLSPLEASRIREQRVRALNRWRAIHRRECPTALYRCFDAQGDVGITFDPETRWRQHSKVKVWWPEVAKRTVEWLPTRLAAEQAEAVAINRESPQHNIMMPVVAYRAAVD